MKASHRIADGRPRATLVEATLRASELRYRRLFAAAQDGILILDYKAGRVSDVNPFLINLLGFSRDEIIGKTVGELSPFKDLETNKVMLARLQKEGYVAYKDLPLETKDGRKLAVEFVCNVYQAGDKKVIQCNIRDITARKSAEDEKNRLNAELERRVVERTEQLQAANQELETFSYSVSHDLRVPLRHILGFVEALRKDAGLSLSETILQHLATICQSAQRMGTMIDDLLAFSHVGRAALRTAEVNLVELVREARGDFRAETEDRKIVWKIGRLPPVWADRALLRMVLVNLISNAVKFTGARAEAKIEIGCVPGDSREKIIFIRDNGAGFDPKYAGKLFDPFQRLHNRGEFEGTGIGLATVQRIIRRHGGQVWAEGVVDAGATFYFSLPNHQPARASINHGRPPQPATPDGPRAGEILPQIKRLKMTSPLHILHLEDDPTDAALVQSTLTSGGITCATTCVQNRADFVAALELGGISLILSDFAVPTFDGFASLEVARARCPNVPFIFVSGTLGEELAIESLKRGATDYVLKERLARLVPAIHRALAEVKGRLERILAEKKRGEDGRRLKVLSRRLFEAQETERRYLARELHDEIGQSLTVAQLNLQTLLQAPPVKVMWPRLQESLDVVDRVLEQVHDIALNLRPSILDDLGLEPALRWLTDRQAALVGVQASFHADPLEHRLDPVIETECFRVVQGALTNVLRHAQAKKVTVELRQADGQFHVRVRDDGIGFDVPALREKAVHGASLGLLSMEERAVLAGGGLEFKSTPHQGTEVHAWFPLKWRVPSP